MGSETPMHAGCERIGVSDAGVECYRVLKDGGEWGLWVKYFTSSLKSSQCTMDALDQTGLAVLYLLFFRCDKSQNRTVRVSTLSLARIRVYFNFPSFFHRSQRVAFEMT